MKRLVRGDKYGRMKVDKRGGRTKAAPNRIKADRGK